MPGGFKQLCRIAGKRRNVVACLAGYLLVGFSLSGDFDDGVEISDTLRNLYRTGFSMEFLSQDLLSRALFACLIPLFSRSIGH